MPKRKPQRVRNWQAVAAQMRNSAGAMGGTKRQRNRRDRAAAKRDLR